MLSSWFGSKSSRHSHSRRRSLSPQQAPDNAKSGPSDTSSVSHSLQTPGNLTSPSDVPLDEVHAHINDPSVYAPTPSLIHSAEKDTGTPRTPEAPTLHRERVSTPKGLERTPFTPQDAVLARVFGKSVPPPTDYARGTTPPPAAQPSVSMTTRTTDSLPPPPSTQTAPAPSARTGSKVTIYDPFSGARLGEHASTATATVTDMDPFARLPMAGDDHRLWSSLERILELQAEIAVMHADMEGVGKGVGTGAGSGHAGPGGVAVGAQGVGEGGRVVRKRSRRGQTLPIGDEEPEEHAVGLAASEISTERSEGEEDEEDDDDDDDVRGFGKRRRDGEFARLAEQFAQRKVAIGGILNKLDDLSMALKTFHTLPPPLFNLAAPPSRSGTLSSSPSNASAPPSSPTNLYPRRSSSPLSSISPLHIGNPVIPPMVPVPPLSTLASPVSESMSSEDLDTPPKLFGGVVTPVLPRTIIPEALHVESPADMGPTQSAFYSMP